MSMWFSRLALSAICVAGSFLALSASGVRAASEQSPLRPAGDEAPSSRHESVLRAGLLTVEASREFRLDGSLGEAFWATADSSPDLVEIEPDEGGVPQGRTVIRVLANPEEILIGVKCFDPDPKGIVAYSKARDAELDEEDHVLIVLDTFGDQRSGYVFAVNPNGSRFDGLVTAQGDDVNSNWDAIWDAAATPDPTGWSAEIRLPIKSLRFKRGLTRWGFNVERRLQRLQETSRWSGAKRDFQIFQTSQAGALVDLPTFDLGLGLTLRPGLVGGPKRPFPKAKRDFDRDISFDANQLLGPNLAAVMTINTDFGETEADARQTNLTRF